MVIQKEKKSVNHSGLMTESQKALLLVLWRVVNLATNLALNLGNYLVLMLDLYLELKTG